MKRPLTRFLSKLAIAADYVRLRAALARAMRHPGTTTLCCSQRQGIIYSLTFRMDMINVRLTDIHHNLRRSHFLPAERTGRYLWRSVQ